jgi:hypothetical protein
MMRMLPEWSKALILLAGLVLPEAGYGLSVLAAPVSGSAIVDIVFFPAEQCKLSSNGQSWVCTPGTKIDKISMKLETNIVLTLSVSGVDITSSSVFTFKGLEFQSFVTTGTVGALAFRTQLIFAPNIVEVQTGRDAFGGTIYCISVSDPGPIAGGAFNCPYAGSTWYSLVEGSYIHSVVANLFLAALFDAAGHLDPTLIFRKKIVDLSLSLAGVTIGLRGLFANLGSAQSPTWRMGIVSSVEGRTVGGITVRAETWIGARQGLECFGECKPLERIRGGVIEDQFVVYEEKIFIRNLKVAGVTFGAWFEFVFFDPGPGQTIGLSFIQLTQAFTLAPFDLTINNTIYIQGAGLAIIQDVITTQLKVGDISATASFYVRPAVTGALNIYFAQLTLTFDPPGVKVTDVLTPCLDENVCTKPDGLLDHKLALSTTIGDVSLNIELYLTGFVTGFYRAIVDVGWRVGNVAIKSSSVIGVNVLLGQRIGLEISF